MTISKELLEASGLAFEAKTLESGLKFFTYSAGEINEILCEKLEASYGLKGDAIELSDYFPNADFFVLRTKPQPIPPPKEVKVTSEVMENIRKKFYAERQGSSNLWDFALQELFEKKNEF